MRPVVAAGVLNSGDAAQLVRYGAGQVFLTAGKMENLKRGCFSGAAEILYRMDGGRVAEPPVRVLFSPTPSPGSMTTARQFDLLKTHLAKWSLEQVAARLKKEASVQLGGEEQWEQIVR